jgi:hypothetical protein
VGIEYTLRFQHPDGAAIAAVLSPLPFFRPVSEAAEFEVRAKSSEGMPDQEQSPVPLAFFCFAFTTFRAV